LGTTSLGTSGTLVVVVVGKVTSGSRKSGTTSLKTSGTLVVVVVAVVVVSAVVS
jgi:hypothetical protein